MFYTSFISVNDKKLIKWYCFRALTGRVGRGKDEREARDTWDERSRGFTSQRIIK